MKLVKKLIFTSILLLVFFTTTFNVNAESGVNIDNINFNDYTDDEIFDFEGGKYTLKNYINSIFSVNEPRPEQSLYACNVVTYVASDGPTMSVTGDDPIISLIPKELFKTPNICKVHIGKEYGFFIKTKTIDDFIYSNVYLFDLINSIGEIPSTYKFTVKPLFQREFVYFSTPVNSIKTKELSEDLSCGLGEYNKTLFLDINTNDVVAPLAYYGLSVDVQFSYRYFFAESMEFYLNDVKSVFNVANEQHLNSNQPNYNVYNDKGMFITQQYIEYQAKVYNVNDNSFIDTLLVLLDTGIGESSSYFIDMIPGLSYIKELFDTLDNMHSAMSDEIDLVGNKYTYTPMYNTADLQIENYGYLAKSSVSTLSLDDINGDYGEGSFLIYDINDYISFNYQLSYTPVEEAGGYAVPWETRMTRGLSLKFNNYNGNETVQESDICNFIICDNDEREYKDLYIDNLVNILPGGENLFRFTPNKSGHYSFTTNNSLYIPNFEIIDYNFDINTTINQTDIKSEVYLEKGVEYKIRLSYSEIQQFGLFDINYEFTPYEITLGDNQLELLYNEYYYKFVPQADAYYKISSNNSTLQIYDESLNVKSANVDGYSILNSGCNYYVIISKNSYSTNEINLSVLDRMEISYYDNKSDATPVKTMYYTIIHPEPLYMPSKTGYIFNGWETSDGILVEELNNFISPTLNLYARWEAVKYNINYYGIDGLIIKNDTYTIETGFNLDNSITIENYKILYWIDENGDKIPNYLNTIGNINCYPVYAKEKSIITFNVNSEVTDNIEAILSPNVEFIELTYKECIVLPTPSISGFDFEGWYYGTTQYTDNKGQMFSDVNFEDDTELVAKWKRTEYHFNIETIVSNDSYSFNLSMRNSLDISNFSIPLNVVSDNKFAVEFINDKIENLLEEALKNNDLTMELYKPGYHFEYCTTVLNDSSSRIYWIELNDTKNEFMLYPYYESNEYIINIYKENELLQIIDVNYEEYYEKYTNNNICFIPEYDTSITGYIYQGVYRLNGDQIFDSNSKLTSFGLEYLKSLVNLSSIDLEKRDNPITYQIKYNSNGGTGIMANSIHVYDIEKSLSTNTFNRTGYIFIEWNTSVDGSGMSFENSDYVENLSNINNDIIVLYAQWEVITYTVKYTPNGTNGSEYSYTYYYNQTFSISNNPYSKIGYTFKGWSKYSNGTVEFLPGDSVQNLTSEKDKTITLYAIWQVNTYTVTYKNLLKSMYTPNLTSYTYGQSVSLPTSIDYNNGYAITNFEKFYGWYEDANFTKPITQISATRIGNIELYAKYDYTQYLYSSTRSWTITDNDNDITTILIADSEDLENKISEINGAFDTVIIELTLIMREKNDGYQEIRLYATLSNGSKNIVNETEYEYGGTGKNSNFSTVNFPEKEIGMNELSSYEEIYLELGAHGTLADDWEISYICVTLNYIA